MFCSSCQSDGTLFSGLPGVLSNGERCDTCTRIPNDKVAVLLLGIYGALQSASDGDCDPDDAQKALNNLYALTDELGRFAIRWAGCPKGDK